MRHENVLSNSAAMIHKKSHQNSHSVNVRHQHQKQQMQGHDFNETNNILMNNQMAMKHQQMVNSSQQQLMNAKHASHSSHSIPAKSKNMLNNSMAAMQGMPHQNTSNSSRKPLQKIQIQMKNQGAQPSNQKQITGQSSNSNTRFSKRKNSIANRAENYNNDQIQFNNLNKNPNASRPLSKTKQRPSAGGNVQYQQQHDKNQDQFGRTFFHPSQQVTENYLMSQQAYLDQSQKIISQQPSIHQTSSSQHKLENTVPSLAQIVNNNDKKKTKYESRQNIEIINKISSSGLPSYNNSVERKSNKSNGSRRLNQQNQHVPVVKNKLNNNSQILMVQAEHQISTQPNSSSSGKVVSMSSQKNRKMIAQQQQALNNFTKSQTIRHHKLSNYPESNSLAQFENGTSYSNVINAMDKYMKLKNNFNTSESQKAMNNLLSQTSSAQFFQKQQEDMNANLINAYQMQNQQIKNTTQKLTKGGNKNNQYLQLQIQMQKSKKSVKVTPSVDGNKDKQLMKIIAQTTGNNSAHRKATSVIVPRQTSNSSNKMIVPNVDQLNESAKQTINQTRKTEKLLSTNQQKLNGMDNQNQKYALMGVQQQMDNQNYNTDVSPDKKHRATHVKMNTPEMRQQHYYDQSMPNKKHQSLHKNTTSVVVMHPSINQHYASSNSNQLHPNQSFERKSKRKNNGAVADQLRQESKGKNSSNVLVQDGGTGASLKRNTSQQRDSACTSQNESNSNYGGSNQNTLKQNAKIAARIFNQSNHIQIPKVPKQIKENTESQQQLWQTDIIKNLKMNGQVVDSAPQSIASSNFLASGAETANVSKIKHLIEGQKSAQSREQIPPRQETQSSNNTNKDVKVQKVPSRPQSKTKKNAPLQQKPAKQLQQIKSINITQEALRIGKIPTEMVAKNIQMNHYATGKIQASPRVMEMIEISDLIRKSFAETGQAPETTADFYRAGKMLGRGAFGKVNLGMHRLTRKLVAIKCINKEYLSEEKQRNKIMHEVNLLLKLRHDSVVKLYETFETSRHIMLVMELCAGGDLLNFVRKRKKLDENTAKIIFKQIILGLGYIHSKNVLHRDIKLDNILLDGKGKVKIADFGVSKQVKPNEVMFEQSGTPAYIAPEIIKDKGYQGFKADLWSAGIVLYALLYGTVPFKANNMKDLHQQIMQAKFTLKDEISKEAKNLINSLLTTDPLKRLSVSQALKHPWLQNIDESKNLFEEEEQEVIRTEFTYNDPSRFNRNEKVQPDEEPWDCFTEINLDSVNCTLRNESEKSQILAPFNSTMSDVEEFFRQGFAMASLVDKKDMLKFAARCRDQDRQYEINNNADLDNGVYHKFVYSSKGSKDDKDNQNKDQDDNSEHLLSRNSSRKNLDSIQRQKEELKRDIQRLKEPKQKKKAVEENIQSDSDQYDSYASNAQMEIEPKIVEILINFGFHEDYIINTIEENDSNYCLAGYFLLGIDQNY